jgi:hypothetical protein
MKPQLNFSCPESWEKMTPVEGGRYCGSCEKVVRDFSKMNDGEILAVISSSESRLCGRFTNEQLENPFGDYRDRILSLYRRAQSIPRKRYLVKAALLFFATTLLFLTGCRSRKCTHTQGDVRIYDWKEQKSQSYNPVKHARW